PGTYACAYPITITGNLAVTGGPVQLFVNILDPNASTTTDIDITAGSTVNYNGSVDASGKCVLSGTLPDATQLQIFTNGAGLVGDSSGKGYCFGGILYAPNASLTGNGCKSSYLGAVVINIFTCNGGPNLGFYYDNALKALFGPWTTSGYTQIPPSTVQTALQNPSYCC
ncbi:MAG TPA: hypothetical protein VG298_09550, partial [Acidimicrobiales bacterium]|nr:hypothetical protein [Acidimicrobiales bacterium]